MLDVPLPQQPAPVVRPLRRELSVLLHALATAVMIVSEWMVVLMPAVLFHCALRNGRRAAWLAFFSAAAPLALLLLAVPSLGGVSPSAMHATWHYLTTVVLAIALPSLAVLPLIARRERFGVVLTLLLLGSALGLLATEVVLRRTAGFSPLALVTEGTRQANQHMLQLYRQEQVPVEALQLMQRWTDFSLTLVPAMQLLTWAMVFVLSLLLLGRIEAWREHAAGRRRGEAPGPYFLRNLALPEWLLLAFVAGGLTPLAHGMLQTVGANVLTVVSFLYVLQGLAIFRSLLLSFGAGCAGTMYAWLLLLFLTPPLISPLLLGMAGLFDPFFDFRKFKRKDDSHESHTD